MDEGILSKCSTKNSINNIPYSNFLMAEKRKLMEDDNNISRYNNIYMNKRVKVSLFENFESLKKQRLSENDICIDHFKDMDKYINQVKELKDLYNSLFTDNLKDEHDLLYVNKKFCSIQCNDIIDRNIFFENSTERSNSGLYNYGKSVVTLPNDALIKKKQINEVNIDEVTSNEIDTSEVDTDEADFRCIEMYEGDRWKNLKMERKNAKIKGTIFPKGRRNVNNTQKINEENLCSYLRYNKRMRTLGKRVLNCVSNQILYIDDLSMYDILLLVSFVTQLQNEQKENEKEEKNLEVMANIDDFRVNAHSLKEIFRSYYKEKCFQCFTCGIRFSTSLEKLNHLENHYKKNKYYTSSTMEKAGVNRNKKKIIYLDHMSIPIEFFICKDYSIFEDVYENNVTKNCNSFYYNSNFDTELKTINVNNNYENVNDFPFLKSSKGEKKAESNFVNQAVGLTADWAYDAAEHAGARHSFVEDSNLEAHLNKVDKFVRNKKERSQDRCQEETLDFYISSKIHKMKEIRDTCFDNNAQNLFHFRKNSSEIDHFFWSKWNNDTQRRKNEKKSKKKFNNIENDENDTSADNDNMNNDKYKENEDEMNFFDFIYGNQNTYDVNLSNYYIVTEDNSVHINYIDGEVMYKNIMKCLEINDINNYEFPSWIPRRSIHNFLIKPVTEIYRQHANSSNSYGNISVTKGMGNIFMNQYATSNSKLAEKQEVQNNIWNLCTNGDFYLSKHLTPMKVFFPLSLGEIESTRYEKHNNKCVMHTGGVGKEADQMGTLLKITRTSTHKDIHDIDTKVINEERTISYELNPFPDEINQRKGIIEKRILREEDQDPLDENERANYSMEDCANNETCESYKNKEKNLIIQKNIMQSFLHIFDEKFFLQTSAFIEVFLYYLRDKYFKISHNFKNDKYFNDTQDRLFSYILNNYTQKKPIFDINNYEANKCFLCKENLLFDYSYEYNDFYYTDALSVDLNNLFDAQVQVDGCHNDNDNVNDQENSYSFNFYTRRIDELSDKFIYSELSYDILDEGMKEAENFFKKIENYSTHLDIGMSQHNEEKNATTTMTTTTTTTTSDDRLDRKDEEEEAPAYSSISMNDLLENVKKIIVDKCMIKRTVIEPSLSNSQQLKNKNNKKKDDHIHHYRNLFKNLCIPYETLRILHNIQKEENNKNSTISTSQFDINQEYANEEIDKFVNYFENVTQQVTNSISESAYKDKKKDKHIFNHITSCYINDDDEKKENFIHTFFPSKNYLHTNFTCFHNQCFKMYVHYYFFPYYFLTKLDDHVFKKIVISAITNFFKAYQRICVFKNSNMKQTRSLCVKRKLSSKEKQFQRRKYF
ncbi:hypothetical protein, conserved [Plasmodium gonderi]|uniref:C2H2-type domain-containing protein n=1 Tax=Plasmodium gonderi TaxID=77519 RepID=A0A1Y1JJS9_PLAGO|nr:hypothetical protein, conserved [Plasmodium gonderi]GAW82500.1 hypothetical protein, conserved [Plasmodium gonderi]